MDEQFSKFVEVIQKLYINVPLLDAIQVPTYARYIRAILNNSVANLNMSPEKKDLGCPTIDCSIRD